MSTNFFLIFAVLSALNFVFANVAVFKKCDEVTMCDISEVRIDPCTNPKKCSLKKGSTSTISFDFTPKFSSDKMLTGLFWASDTGDVSFPDLERANACNFTTCPLEAEKENQLNYGLVLGKKLPNGIFDIKWKLWNPDNEKELCCFVTKIELRKNNIINETYSCQNGRTTVPFINCFLKTMDVRLVIFFAFYICVNCEYVNRKFCKDVNLNKCNIHSMKLDPCPDAPGFCLIRRDEPYSLAFDFTPHFEAEKLKFSIFSDETNSGTFDTMVTPPTNACEHVSCPLENNVRQVFDIDFVYTRKAHGKFPLEMRLWNEKDDSEACCLTFNVQMLK
ncbi:uncharacterized protein LOC126769725 [Nymphalis io]|uniref:uncharacterized protein LOC126769725 n=1 Tax=Inachis io TaxID=171585 RepID=UPI0021674966|nr:uncharacterized protein LOC126769725 [Nymphalis io]